MQEKFQIRQFEMTDASQQSILQFFFQIFSRKFLGGSNPYYVSKKVFVVVVLKVDSGLEEKTLSCFSEFYYLVSRSRKFPEKRSSFYKLFNGKKQTPCSVSRRSRGVSQQDEEESTAGNQRPMAGN